MSAIPGASLPSPEVVPSREQHTPEIGPNLAADPDLCKELCEFLIPTYWRPYFQQQQVFWPAWEQLDRAWRAKLQLIDLQIPLKFWDEKSKQALTAGADGTLKVCPTDMHKQWDALLKVIMNFSWEGGLPVSSELGDYVFETLYNPTQQSVDALNSILRDNAEKCDLQTEYRKNLSCFLVYGRAWALTDLKRSFEDVKVRYKLGPDQVSMHRGAQELAMKYQGQQPEVENNPDGSVTLCFYERRVKEFSTPFTHLNVDDVFTDLTMTTTDMDLHPCPFVRRHIAEFVVEENDYDPQNNPFGWLNVQQALTENGAQYVLSNADEGPRVAKLSNRFNLSDQGKIDARHTQKQLWIGFPKLRVAKNNEGKLKIDRGDGLECPNCVGKGKLRGMTQEGETEVKCPTCRGAGKAHPPAERYVAEFYGNPYLGGVTCLRIQKLTKGTRVPILSAVDMVEDTSCAVPTCKGEIAMNDLAILAECENILLHDKRMSAHRGWKVQEDSLAMKMDLDTPAVKIPIATNPDEVERLEHSTYDTALTLAPYMAERQERIKAVLGATDQILGMISSGRRSAFELSNAADASRNPIIVTGDSYNRQMLGGWANTIVSNVDMWGDRDFIRGLTGREYIGKARFHTAKAEQYVRKIAQANEARTMLQVVPQLLPLMPQLQPVVTELLRKYFKNSGLGDIIIPDDGLLEAQQEAMSIISRILGEGAMLPPLSDDPDEIFVRVFESCIRKIRMGQDYWSGKCEGTTLPFLEARLMMQRQQLQAKQQAMLMQQMQMQAMMNPQPQQGAPAKRDQSKSTPGGQIQAAQGAAGASAQ